MRKEFYVNHVVRILGTYLITRIVRSVSISSEMATWIHYVGDAIKEQYNGQEIPYVIFVIKK